MEAELGTDGEGVGTGVAVVGLGGDGVEPRLTELGVDGVETALEVEGGRSEARVVVDGAEAELAEAKLGADGVEATLADGGGHSTRDEVTRLGDGEGELELEPRACPVLSQWCCFFSRLSRR